LHWYQKRLQNSGKVAIVPLTEKIPSLFRCVFPENCSLQILKINYIDNDRIFPVIIGGAYMILNNLPPYDNEQASIARNEVFSEEQNSSVRYNPFGVNAIDSDLLNDVLASRIEKDNEVVEKLMSLSQDN
jgi:hypothetical protein